MTILFVTHYSGLYGANKSLLALMLLLRARHGVEPYVLMPNRGAMCGELDKNNIPYIVSHYYWWVNDEHGLFKWIINRRKQWRNWWRLNRIIKLLPTRLDLVYSNSTTINMGFLIAQRLHIPHVWHLRESMSQFRLSLSLSLSRSLRIYRAECNKRYILISDYMMRAYADLLPQDRMVRIYNGISLPAGVEPRTTNTLRDGVLHVALVGIISEQKNQMELLKAIHLLCSRNRNVHAHFIGGGHSAIYAMQLQRYINDNNLTAYVTFHGHQSDVYAILRQMNLGIVCARDEAFGRTTIEFMLMHMPVVASDSGANPELITPGVNGVIYPFGNIERLAEAIENYTINPKLLQSQGDEAAKEARENFTAERNAELIYEQIQKSIKSK